MAAVHGKVGLETVKSCPGEPQNASTSFCHWSARLHRKSERVIKGSSCGWEEATVSKTPECSRKAPLKTARRGSRGRDCSDWWRQLRRSSSSFWWSPTLVLSWARVSSVSTTWVTVCWSVFPESPFLLFWPIALHCVHICSTFHSLSCHHSTFLCVLTFWVSLQLPLSSSHPLLCPSILLLTSPLFPCCPPPLVVSSVTPSDHSTPVFASLSPEKGGLPLWRLDSGTSICLVGLLFALWGVFSNSSFSQPCPAHHTSLCACVCERVWECADAPQSCEFVHSWCTFLAPYVHTHLCSCFAAFLLSSGVFTELSCLDSDWAYLPKAFPYWWTNEPRARPPSCFLHQQTFEGNQRVFMNHLGQQRGRGKRWCPLKRTTGG